MKEHPSLSNFTINIRVKVLHKLLQGLVDRAYELGYDDGKSRSPNPSRVRIDIFQLRKLRP